MFMNEHYSKFFKSYLKYIDIADLKDLLPSILNIVVANNENDESIKLEYCHFKKIEIIWDIIKVAVENLVTNYNSLNKRELLNILDPIKYCYLIPVRYSSSKQVHLLQISQCKKIFFVTSSSRDKDLLNFVIKEIDMPTLDPKFYVNLVLKNILVCFDRNGDILEFLNENKENKIIFKKENKDAFLKLINNCILLKYASNGETYLEFENNPQNPIATNQIKQIIRYLPIFTDLFEYIYSLQDKTVYLLSLDVLPNEVLKIMKNNQNPFFQEDFIDFCNKTDLILIEYYQEYERLYKYLDLKVIKLDDFYPTFFNWCLTQPAQANLKKTFKDHVDVLRIQDEHNQLNNEIMRELLKTLPFISFDEKTFYGINQLLDERNKLFEICFPNRIIPIKNQYRSLKWRSFLVKFGLKSKADVEDCGKIANILAEKYNSNQINLNQMESYIKELFRVITHELNNENEDKNSLDVNLI